jgi:UDP-glucose 6-dehydrogenase
MRNRIGIIGHGFVGQAVEAGFSLNPLQVINIYDKYKNLGSLDHVVNESDVIFICVPTPMDISDETGYGRCDTSIVEEVVYEAADIATSRKVFVIKSTVPPGTTNMISKELDDTHTVLFNPEFLTEKNFKTDFINQKNTIIGLDELGGSFIKPDIKKLVSVYDEFRQSKTEGWECAPGAHAYGVDSSFYKIMPAKAAELVKYATNTFLANKVIFFNNLREVCAADGISFEAVKSQMKTDSRVGTSHMQVPGPDDQFGFGGTCFPKDINGFLHYACDLGLDMDNFVTATAWEANSHYRETEDWKERLGATTSHAYGDESLVEMYRRLKKITKP